MIGKNILEWLYSRATGFRRNPYHPTVWILGDPRIGKNVYIGGMSEINASKASVVIGDDCDIASFVSINCADSHKQCIGVRSDTDYKNILIGESVFIGSHCVIKGGATIGSNSVVAAGTVVEGENIPEYSLVYGNPMSVKPGYYKAPKKNLS